MRKVVAKVITGFLVLSMMGNTCMVTKAHGLEVDGSSADKDRKSVV